MCGLCSRRLLTVWKTSKIPSAFTRSRTVLKAQKVPVRPAPALKQSRHTYHTCCLWLSILRGKCSEEQMQAELVSGKMSHPGSCQGKASVEQETHVHLCPLSLELHESKALERDGFLLPSLCALGCACGTAVTTFTDPAG